MRRVETYVGSQVYEWVDSAQAQSTMTAIAKACAAMFGVNTIANGLPCTPTSPASMTVQIGAGEIYQMTSLEATVCGTLPADTTHQILKQGIQLGTYTSATLAAPLTSGQSINYLIQAQYQDSDISLDPTTGNTAVVLQFYDNANPNVPWSGPNNSGATSNTFRDGIVAYGVKAGAAATTGSQVTPSPDSGYVGLWVVTVSFGQTTITSGNIAAYAGAPILPSSLFSSIQNGNLVYGVDVGSVNTIHAVYPIPPTGLGENQPFWVKVKVTNTGAVTFTPNVGVIAASPVVGAAHQALHGGEFVASGRALLIWRADITSYVLIECTGGALQVGTGAASQHAATVGQVQSGSLYSAIAGGTADALTATFTPAITAVANQTILVRAASANATTTPTINPGLWVITLVKGNNLPLAIGDIAGAGHWLEITLDATLTKGVLQNPATGVTGSAGGQVQGAFKNLAAHASGSDVWLYVTADQVSLESSGGIYKTVSVVNLGINSAGTGPNGLDTGVLAASTWYNTFVISNGTTTAGLISLSATAPTLPSSYTYFARVGTIRTDATANKYPLAFLQYGRRVQYKVVTGSNVPGYPAIASGVAGSVSTPTYVAASVSSVTPPTASAVKLLPFTGSVGANIMVSPNNQTGIISSTTNPPTDSFTGTSSGGTANIPFELLLESSNIYWATNDPLAFLRVLGWEDNL